MRFLGHKLKWIESHVFEILAVVRVLCVLPGHKFAYAEAQVRTLRKMRAWLFTASLVLIRCAI